jgi:hypothetical protein
MNKCFVLLKFLSKGSTVMFIFISTTYIIKFFIRLCSKLFCLLGATYCFTIRVLRFPQPIFISPIAPQSPSSIIWGLYNRPELAAVPSGLSPTPLIIINNNCFTNPDYHLIRMTSPTVDYE